LSAKSVHGVHAGESAADHQYIGSICHYLEFILPLL
jgi:hypothetical protein